MPFYYYKTVELGHIRQRTDIDLHVYSLGIEDLDPVHGSVRR
jgi:hypothetical protein